MTNLVIAHPKFVEMFTSSAQINVNFVTTTFCPGRRWLSHLRRTVTPNRQVLVIRQGGTAAVVSTKSSPLQVRLLKRVTRTTVRTAIAVTKTVNIGRLPVPAPVNVCGKALLRLVVRRGSLQTTLSYETQSVSIAKTKARSTTPWFQMPRQTSARTVVAEGEVSCTNRLQEKIFSESRSTKTLTATQTKNLISAVTSIRSCPPVWFITIVVFLTLSNTYSAITTAVSARRDISFRPRPRMDGTIMPVRTLAANPLQSKPFTKETTKMATITTSTATVTPRTWPEDPAFPKASFATF